MLSDSASRISWGSELSNLISLVKFASVFLAKTKELTKRSKTSMYLELFNMFLFKIDSSLYFYENKFSKKSSFRMTIKLIISGHCPPNLVCKCNTWRHQNEIKFHLNDKITLL